MVGDAAANGGRAGGGGPPSLMAELLEHVRTVHDPALLTDEDQVGALLERIAACCCGHIVSCSFPACISCASYPFSLAPKSCARLAVTAACVVQGAHDHMGIQLRYHSASRRDHLVTDANLGCDGLKCMRPHTTRKA